MPTKELKDFSINQFEEEVAQANLPRFRAMQVLTWVYQKNAGSYEDMTNLPKAMRDQFESLYPLYKPSIEARQESTDGSVKYLLKLNDGYYVETVALPAPDNRLSVCISSQSGCAMGCVFCATGRNGLKRNLLPGELVDQVLTVQDDFGRNVTNVVVMGQGEPFSNYDNTLSALRILNHPKLLNIGARHITVSTCGLLSGIERFSEEPEQFTLAISLHSAKQDVRDSIMPYLKNQKLGSLRKALENYATHTGRRFSFEYALMKDINDSEDDLEELIRYCKRLLCHVNLIPLNSIEGSPIIPSPRKTAEFWQKRLEDSGIATSIRKSRGSDISAACGQLASKYK